MISSSLLLKMSVPYRNRTYNRVLGVRASSVNSCQGAFIIVKESLAFSNFPVILCKNKKIEIILCKTLRVSKLLDLLTNRQSHSVPSNSLIWLPFTLSCGVMIAYISIRLCLLYRVWGRMSMGF